MRILKKLFGGINLTWPKLIIFAVAAGVYTALIAIIPFFSDTSFYTIVTTFEVWVLFGILIIMNAKSNKDAALKSFVFFLISQPLVYLLQVPFSPQGWKLLNYYPYWFVWTVLCLPMGYIGYYIKKNKWWGYLILFPMILFTASGYYTYLTYFTFCRPFFILISVFCAAAMIVYPIALFDSKKIRLTGVLISAFLILLITIWVALHPYRYTTDILSTVEGENISEEYQVSLADESIGDVSVARPESLDFCLVHADFKKSGHTELIVVTPDGKTVRYDLRVRMNKFQLTEK